MDAPMKTVMPIKDREMQKEFAEYFERTSQRNYVMFMCGIYLGLRISDILQLRVHDVRGTHLEIKEQKNKNNRRIFINRKLRKALDDYIEGKRGNELLFTSRKHSATGKAKALTRKGAIDVLKKAAKDLQYVEPIGTHSLRKTFAYNYYQMYGDLAELQKLLGHKDQTDTIAYIGLEQETFDERIANM